MHYLCDEYRQQLGSPPLRLSDQALAQLRSAPWPGNVRELENVLQRAVLLAMQEKRSSTGGQLSDEPLLITPNHCRLGNSPAQPAVALTGSPHTNTAPKPLRQRLDDFQRQEIQALLGAHRNNWAAVARSLGLHRSNLHRLATRLGLREET